MAPPITRSEPALIQLRTPARGGGEPAPSGELEAAGEAPPPELDTLLADIGRLEGIVSAWDVSQREMVHLLQRATDALHKEALRRLIAQLKAEPSARDALKAAALDEVVYAVLRHHGLVRATLNERLQAALAFVRPLLASHGGDVELVELSPPNAVTIRLLGSCDGCPSAGLTLSAGVERAIQEHCPEITEIRHLKGTASLAPRADAPAVSPFAAGTWVVALELAELAPEGVTALELAGHSLLIVRFAERLSCFENACVHFGLPMTAAELRGGVLRCPHHGFEYGPSGECLTLPGSSLKARPVRISGLRVEVMLS